MTTSIKPAPEDQQSVIKALMQPYLAEMSNYTDDVERVDGEYHYPYLPFYWKDPDRFPFLILVEDEIVGFVLTRRATDPVDGSSWMEVAELFVEKSHRRSGVAKTVVCELWREPGSDWRIGVLERNQSAYEFWKPLVAAIDPAFREIPAGLNPHGQIVFHLTT